MYAELYQYLISYKQVALPGIGTFSLERKPAENDFSNKRINPPVYSVNLHFPAKTPSGKFYQWLSGVLSISESNAINAFNDFALDIRNKISNGEIIDWSGVGTLSRGLAGEIKFKSAVNNLGYEEPVTAEKVIREKAEHMVRVGEDQKTSAEMTELLNQPEEKKSYWWAYALALALGSIVFIGWHFSEHGVDVAATANNKSIVPLEAGAAYKTLP
jgi:nucleoid DNA-binding protein